MEDTPHEISEERHGSSRRDFIKKSAVIGAAVWSSPAISTLSSKAWAQTTGYAPCPECPNCQAEATGLRALGLSAGRAAGSGCQCVANVNLGAGEIGGASSQTVCGRADNATCSASSFVEGLAARIATNAVLEATVLASCVSCGTGDSFIAKLELVTTTDGVDTRTQLDVPADGCNATITVPGVTGVTVVANEQFCQEGTLTVRALRITVAGLDVIAAESKAGATGCPCNACSTNPTCTPPTERLC